MKWEVVISGFLPTTVNELLKLHWAQRHKRKRTDCDLVGFLCIEKCVPLAATKRRVTVTFSAPGGRGAKHSDKDARYKVLLDALVKCGRLVDDSDKWCEWMPPTHVKGKKQTMIVLEDVEDGAAEVT